MKKYSFVFVITIILSCCFLYNNTFTQDNYPYQNIKLSIEQRVENLLQLLTIEEKISLLGGTGFATTPIERLNIPPLNMTDGPLGVRWDEATAFPSGISLASSWEPELIYKVGKAIGEEVKSKERHVILGPCVNIARIPQGGRNFESFGEDPWLTSRLAIEYIKGVQSENVVATVKHFACNNQEYQRDFVNTIVDKRALNEIYLPAFKAAVLEADVYAVMSAYNKINDFYASENDFLLIDKLKKEWGFKGLVMSDWGAVHSSVPTYNSGLDLEMPKGVYLNSDALLSKIENGELQLSKLNDKVARILTIMFKIGLFDDYKYDKSKLNNEEHKKLAYESAVKGIVLLKNKFETLPIYTDNISSIAIIGPNADYARIGGGGSSQMSPFYSVSPLQALREKIDKNVEINYAPGIILDGDSPVIGEEYFFIDKDGKESGIKVSYFDNMSLTGNPKVEITEKSINHIWGGDKPNENISADNFSARWEGYLKAPKTGTFTLNVSADDGTRLYIEDELLIDDWKDHGELTNFINIDFEQNKLYKIKLEFYENAGDAIVKFGWQLPDDDLMAQAINIAQKSDLAIVFVGTTKHFESEGKDREDLVMPNKQDELIEAVLKANKNTIVVLTSGSPILMNKWIDKVNTVVQCFFAGQEIGNAIADVILGKFNPSGKLPITYPNKWEDCSAFSSYLKEDGTTNYTDGIYVGYRYFEKNNITPLFPFGYGLSYTKYKYSDLVVKQSAKDINITFKVKNTGYMLGAEITQLYVQAIDSKIDRAIKELKGFKKVYLNPNEETTIELNLDLNSLNYYDIDSDSWKLEKCKYKILIGASSEDIKLNQEIELN
ncbi:MAG: glycoside hydrolase family 3 C-terminal domain-containing protein [bacterium]